MLQCDKRWSGNGAVSRSGYPVCIGRLGSVTHSDRELSYRATLPWPSRVSQKVVTLAAIPALITLPNATALGGPP